MPDLDLDLLRAFVAVADAGTFTAAADVVGRSQSAVSQKIRRLEELIRQPVFDRTSRSLSLMEVSMRSSSLKCSSTSLLAIRFKCLANSSGFCVRGG